MINKFFKKLFSRDGELIISPKILKSLNCKKILVLAPHFDDACIGMGGTLEKLSSENVEIKVIYMTDGISSSDENIKKIREGEAKEALKILGINEFSCLEEPEANEKIKSGSINTLRRIIFNFKPDHIFLPWYKDNHKDHKKLNHLLKKSFQKINYDCFICGYEVWTPNTPNVLVDISKEIEKKKKAISQFKSQLKINDYLYSNIGLNKFWTIYDFKNKMKYAEAFFIMPSKKYFKFY